MRRKGTVFREILAILAISTIIFYILQVLGVGEKTIYFLQRYRFLHAEELLITALFLVFALAIFSRRRLRELKIIVAQEKLMEEESRNLKQRIEFILGATKTGLDIIDADFNIVYIDPEWAKVYGGYKGKKCFEYFADRYEPCPGCGLPRALETKKPVTAEEVLPKEGNRPIQVITIPYQDKDGKWFFAEANVDISERKRIEEELIQAGKLAGIGEMAAGIAHEINNPLAAILGYVQLMVKNEEMSISLKKDLHNIEKEARRCVAAIENLLNFARPKKLRKEEVDMAHILDATMQIAKYFILREEIKVVKKYGAEIPKIKVDPVQIQQVLMNIIINAVHAMSPGGGTLTLQMQTQSSAAGKEVAVAITDTGTGMTGEIKDKIFQPFASIPYKGGHKGTGLGLFISRTIIKEHNGRIEVESQVGKGSTFRIILPVN